MVLLIVCASASIMWLIFSIAFMARTKGLSLIDFVIHTFFFILFNLLTYGCYSSYVLGPVN